jgi:hypothetical protein
MYRLHQQEVAVGRTTAIAMLVGLVAPPAVGVARAEHDMATMEPHDGSSELSVGVTLEAAEFETLLYVGSYQGVAPSLGWTRGALGASATIGLYHLTENGLSRYGMGDAMVAGHVVVVATDAVQAGGAVHVLWPTGSEPAGLGMGHVMVMPSAWGTWRAHPFTISASAGYGRALVARGGHDHGPMPLVDPMNLQELTWTAGADLDVGRGVRLGGRTIGAIPIGTGVARVIGAGRVAWGTPRLSTAFELQLGIAGDPFTIRGVVDTALRF